MSRLSIPTFILISACSVALVGCDQAAQPQQVCAAADTLSNVRDLLNEAAVKDADKAYSGDALTAALKQQWTAGALKLDLVTLKSADHDTKKIECAGQLQIKLPEAQQKAVDAAVNDPEDRAHVGAYIFKPAADGSRLESVTHSLNEGQATVDLTFSRQPSADGKSFVVSFEAPSGSSQLLRFVAAAQILSGKASQNAAVSSASPAAPDASSSAPADDQAALEARYTPAYDQCLKEGDAANGVTAAMADCSDAEIKAQDSKLNAAYQKAMSGQTPEAQVKLREAERAWIKFRDSKCESENQTRGTMDILNRQGCILEATIRRTIELEEMQAR
jgi:uncharacterized protein YecT (DUF1311 family)